MGTWALWIAFHAGVALLLLLDLGVFHRQPRAIAPREAAVESAAWVALSVAFGLWIFFSRGRGPGLEFFAGYLIEKSLSVDNVFVFLLIFQFFRVDPRYQHRLLFWGVLGALAMRGAMIGVGTALIQHFAWILYVFGAFLLYAGFRLFGAKRLLNPQGNPMIRWMRGILPMSKAETGSRFIVSEGGRWLVTPLFLVVIVLETTDLIFAVDSIPAVFGVTHDPFLVYTSNVCAILGLRAFYFLLAGILPYFKYLDSGLALVLMFIGGKMLAEPWLHISTEMSLAIVGATIAFSVLISLFAARRGPSATTPGSLPIATSIRDLCDENPQTRIAAANALFDAGRQRISTLLTELQKDREFNVLFAKRPANEAAPSGNAAIITVGVAVWGETFDGIRAANNSEPLAEAPTDQDVLEFELHFPENVRLDILTTKDPHGGGAIARFLTKFGEEIQQVEIDVTDVDRATQLLNTRFKLAPVYPATRAGANGTRVNFFLVGIESGGKVLLELVEQAKSSS